MLPVVLVCWCSRGEGKTKPQTAYKTIIAPVLRKQQYL
jgi:hypothetical protein